MSDNQFHVTVESLFKGMDGFMSSKTVVGEPLRVNDSIILPLVDVSFGMAAGAWNKDRKDSAAGGIGGKLSPSAVLVIKDGTVRIVPVNPGDPVSKIIDMAPDLINRFISKSDPDVEQTIERMKEDAKNE
jgi:uncharacterized spore protein YtfJ